MAAGAVTIVTCHYGTKKLVGVATYTTMLRARRSHMPEHRYVAFAEPYITLIIIIEIQIHCFDFLNCLKCI